MAALRSPLVGRARELNQLNGLLDETLETATPRFVLVYGPAGIGKSRLIVEFLAAARERSEPRRAHRPLPSDRSRDHVLGPGGDSSAGLRDRARRPGGRGRREACFAAPAQRSRGSSCPSTSSSEPSPRSRRRPASRCRTTPSASSSRVLSWMSWRAPGRASPPRSRETGRRSSSSRISTGPVTRSSRCSRA